MNLIIGLSQFATIILCLVGWCWSIGWGITLISVSSKLSIQSTLVIVNFLVREHLFTIDRLFPIYEENAKLVIGKVHYLTEAHNLTKVDYCQVRLFKSDIFSDPFFVFFIQSPNLDCEFSTCYLCFGAVPLSMENPL